MTEPQADAPLAELRRLLDDEREEAVRWAPQLAYLRNAASASAAVFSELARPLEPVHPRRKYVDVLLALPDQQLVARVVTDLRRVLGTAAIVNVLDDQDQGASPLGRTIRCQVFVPGEIGDDATERVRAALAAMRDVDVDYSDSIDLIVVTPRKPAATG
jgi:hypothetical protein